mgnify:CR=1 FL=1
MLLSSKPSWVSGELPKGLNSNEVILAVRFGKLEERPKSINHTFWSFYFVWLKA